MVRWYLGDYREDSQLLLSCHARCTRSRGSHTLAISIHRHTELEPSRKNSHTDGRSAVTMMKNIVNQQLGRGVEQRKSSSLERTIERTRRRLLRGWIHGRGEQRAAPPVTADSELASLEGALCLSHYGGTSTDPPTQLAG